MRDRDYLPSEALAKEVFFTHYRKKTTSQIIAGHILQEAKILLKHSPRNVSEIAYALGFNEVTHFNNFFKKHVQLSPLKFRNILWCDY
jgi:AraC-like DNA-binding protein